MLCAFTTSHGGSSSTAGATANANASVSTIHRASATCTTISLRGIQRRPSPNDHAHLRRPHVPDILIHRTLIPARAPCQGALNVLAIAPLVPAVDAEQDEQGENGGDDQDGEEEGCLEEGRRVVDGAA